MPVATVPEAPVEAPAALPRIVIPGTLTVPVTAFRAARAEPERGPRLVPAQPHDLEALHPGDLLKPPALAAAGQPAPSGAAPRTYDREAMMDRLLKGGRNAASGICSGC